MGREEKSKATRELTRGLYKRGKIWWIRYAGPDGRMRFESSGSSHIRKAQEILLSRKKDVEEGKDPKPARKMKSYGFKELAKDYLTWAERQRSFKNKKYYTKQLLQFFGNCPLHQFNTRLVEKYQSTKISDGKAPGTVNRHLALIKHMFTKAVEWEMVSDEVLKKVRRVKLIPENNRRLRYLSEEETHALVNSCNSYLKPIVITALNTGMRREEVLSLEWEKNIDLRHRFILLENTKGGERREIPINQVLFDTLKHMQRRIDSPYVFTDENGQRFKEVKKSFKSALRRAGIKDFTFHDLRHTFASHLVMSGADLVTVKELLGHKTLKMTLRYAHLSPGHKAKAVERLAEKLLKGPTIQKTIQSAQITKKGVSE